MIWVVIIIGALFLYFGLIHTRSRLKQRNDAEAERVAYNERRWNEKEEFEKELAIVRSEILSKLKTLSFFELFDKLPVVSLQNARSRDQVYYDGKDLYVSPFQGKVANKLEL